MDEIPIYKMFAKSTSMPNYSLFPFFYQYYQTYFYSKMGLPNTSYKFAESNI